MAQTTRIENVPDTPLQIVEDEFYLQLHEGLGDREIASLLVQYDLEVVDPYASGSATLDEQEQLPVPGEMLRDLRSDHPTSAWVKRRQASPTLDELRNDDSGRILRANPVFFRENRLPKKTGFSYGSAVTLRLADSPTLEDDLSDLLTTFVARDVTDLEADDDPTLRVIELVDPETRDALEEAAAMKARPEVLDAWPEWMQLHPILAQGVPPNDTNYSKQWNLERIGAEAAWNLTKGSTAVTVAIIDTGCHFEHRELPPDRFVLPDERYEVLWKSHDAKDTVGHGTQVAGIIAAEADNGYGIAGVDWHCQIMPIRLPVVTLITDRHIRSGLRWARHHGADVINMSIDSDLPMDWSWAELTKCAAQDIVIVAASGNGCAGATNQVAYPALHPEVIAVGASDPDDNRASWPSGKCGIGESCYGPELDCVAPGVFIYTTWRTDSGARVQMVRAGTSFAAPHVAGLAALIRAHASGLNAAQVREAILSTGRKVGVPPAEYIGPSAERPLGTWNEEMGYGLIDMAAALQYAASLQPAEPQQPQTTTVPPQVGASRGTDTSFSFPGQPISPEPATIGGNLWSHSSTPSNCAPPSRSTPVANASVELQDESGAVIDELTANGHYSFGDIGYSGNYTVTVTVVGAAAKCNTPEGAGGGDSTTISVTTTSGATYTVNFGYS